MQRREFMKQAGMAGAAWLAPGPGDAPAAARVRRVPVVFKCHLDVGFTDTQANVMRAYFEDYYPKAMATAAAMSQAGGDRYVWTTGSWLLFEYLEQASADERRRMDAAVMAGDISWHALPFNWQTEMLDRSMIEGCLGFSRELDRRYGRRTIAAKMTDVPGHSRGLVAPLAANGIRLLDIGVNPASTPPEVPAVFVWRDTGGAEVTMLYHRRAYGGVIAIPETDVAVAVEMRSDNAGPHTPEEIRAIYAGLRRQFPGAEVAAASLSEVAAAIEGAHPRLPVVTEEIGDTWIYGCASDPPKVARYREVARLRREWIANGHVSPGDAEDRQVLRRLALAPEHTWGTDTKRYIDHEHYPPKELAACLQLPGYQIMERSWREKREDIDEGIANLRPALRAEAVARLQTLTARAPARTGMREHDARGAVQTKHYELALDPEAGYIRSLRDKRTGRDWADGAHPLALFTYQTLSQDDYTKFLAAYVLSKESWAPQDFGKPGIERFRPESQTWQPRLRGMWTAEDNAGVRVVAELAVEDPAAEAGGLVAWPRSLYAELMLPEARAEVRITLWTLGKAQNRLPEAMWLTFQPPTGPAAAWTLDKVDQAVSPEDVVEGGGRAMHAVTSGLRCRDGAQGLEIETLDAPVVALGTRSPLNFSRALPDLRQGVHVSLYNNAWGTNYPQWAGGDWMYRFVLRST